MSQLENVLRTIYYEPENPASFSTAEKLYHAAKQILPEIGLNDVRKWLSGEITYTLHKPIRKKFKRNPIIVENIDQQWEADLVDMQEFETKIKNKKKRQNRSYNYILTVIDVMSKFAWGVPMKNKTKQSVVDAFEIIFKGGRIPNFIRTDQGKEFNNKEFKNLMKKYQIHHFMSKNQTVKCAIVERFNRTLKSRVVKQFTASGVNNWVDSLSEHLKAYNNTKHRTIKMTPVEASDAKNKELFKIIYGVNSVEELYKMRNKKHSLEIGDKVRKAYKQGPFDKSYFPNWTDRVYEVETVADEPVKKMYNIKDEKNKREKQRFYPEEIQKITENLYRVEKVLKNRTINGKKQYFVKWLNYPDDFNSWVEGENLVLQHHINNLNEQR